MKRHYLDFVGMSIPGKVSQEFFRLFREHPALCIPAEETHYFSSENISHGRDWYEGHFTGYTGVEKRGELSTSYLHTIGVAQRLAREYPDTKLFAIIPDPLEAVATMYSEAKAADKSHGVPDTLEEFIAEQPKILEMFRFGRHLAAFFSYYSPVDFVVHTYGDVRTDPVAVMKNVYDVLEVDVKFIPKQLVATVTTDADLERPSFFARLLHLDKRKAKRRLEGQALAHTFFELPVMTMTAREQVLLTRYYAEDVVQLSSLLHRNLASEWHHVRPEKTKKGHA